MKLGLTLTGADSRTDEDDLFNLACEGVELAFLYTHDPENRPRYPSATWIESVSSRIPGHALHICGARARQELITGRLERLTCHFNRIQVNGTLTPRDVEILCGWLNSKVIITQHAPANVELLCVNARNHALLTDASGGRGILPTAWDRVYTTKPVGFAGGLGPNNLCEQWPKIAAAAQPGSWIDMENALRTGDWFDVRKAMQVVEIWKELQDAHERG